MRFATALLIMVASALMSSCYKKLYVATLDDKNQLQQQNTQLNSANTLLTKSNDTLSQLTKTLHSENNSLKKQNESLQNQLIVQSQKTKKFDLYFRQLCCDKTTDSGGPFGLGGSADEVYITVLGTKIGIGDIYVRAPGNNNHWDMNDGNQGTDKPTGDSHCLTDRALFSGELKPGETYFLNIAVCEEDGGNTRKYQEIASAVMQKVPVPFVATAGKIIGALTSLGGFFTDTDDWMGMFGVKVTNNDGVLVTEWLAKEGIRHLRADPSYSADPLRREVRMNHDGSNYIGWFGVRY